MTTDMLSAQEITIQNKKSYLPWLVVFSAALFFFYEFIQMQMFNSISHSLISDFKINATMLGKLSSSYFLADVIFLFPAGMILDRISSRKVILTAMWLCVISTAIFARAHSILLVWFCHFFAGIGNAFCFLSCVRLASRWFANRQMALVVGLIVTMAMLGGMVAQTPLAWLIAKVGWRDALMLTAGLGLIIIGVVWMFVHDYPAEKAAIFQSQRQQLKTLGVSKSIVTVLRNPQNWLCGLYVSFMNLPLMMLGGLWGSLYLTTVHQLTVMQASYVTSMVFFGTIVGSPVIGWISDRLGARRPLMIIFAILSLPVMLSVIYFAPLSLWSLIVLFFALGFVTAAQIIGYPVIAESNEKHITGTAMGLASVLIMGSPMIFGPFFGWLMDKHWDGQMSNGVHVYTSQAYYYPMLLMPLVLLLSLVFALGIRKTMSVKENLK